VIENFRDQDVPGFLWYKNGDLKGKIIPAGQICGGLQMNPFTVEFVLSMKEIIEPIEPFEEDPRDKLKLMNTAIIKKKAAGRHLENDDSDGEDDREYCNNQMFRYK